MNGRSASREVEKSLVGCFAPPCKGFKGRSNPLVRVLEQILGRKGFPEFERDGFLRRCRLPTFVR